MRTTLACLSVVSLLTLAGSPACLLHAGEVPAAAQPQGSARASLERFFKIRAPGMVTLAPDGSLYVRDWPDGINQLYRIPKEAVGVPGEALPKSAVRLTDYKDGLAGYSLSEDGTKVLLQFASGGNENYQISLLDPAANGGKGAITPLLANPKVQYAVNGWLRDGSGFLFTGNDESPNDFYIYRWDFAANGGKGAATKILGREGSWSSHGVTNDASRFLVARYISASQSECYELTPSAGGAPALKDISVRNDKGELASTEIIGYLPGEKSVLLKSDVENGITRLFVRDLATGTLSKPLPNLDKNEVDSASINHEKDLLVVVTNEDGYGVLHAYQLPTFEEAALAPIEKGVVSVSDLQGRTIVYSLSNARTPGVCYSYTVPDPKGAKDAVSATMLLQKPKQAHQVTFADTQGLELDKLPLPMLVKYKSFDGVEIPSFLWLPPGYSKASGKTIPFVVNYHGGPEGQFRPSFDRTTEYLTTRGYGVLQPNVRGSTGYGRDFLMMDDYKKRWDSVKDGVEGARWLIKEGYAAPGKIATYGGSYGGFMSVACLVEDGSSDKPVFGAGIDVVGIVNMKTFLEQTSGYRRKLREVEYGPLTDPEFLKSVSSLEKIDKIKVPMFIAHGLNDPRVPVGEAMQLAVGLQERGYDPELFFAPDEGHGFQKLRNRLIFAERMVRFLDKNIKGN